MEGNLGQLVTEGGKKFGCSISHGHDKVVRCSIFVRIGHVEVLPFLAIAKRRSVCAGYQGKKEGQTQKRVETLNRNLRFYFGSRARIDEG